MALPPETPRSFRLYVTHVDGEGPFLRISGQLEQQAPLMVESLFDAARDNLEQGIGAVPPASIHEGVICAAKYKDGIYYRAKVINTTNLATGLVGVHFIDFGNKDIISLSTIRFLDNYDPMFLQLRGQANDYYLSRVVNPIGRWDEPLLLKLQSLLCYSEYPVTVEAQTRTLPIISIQFKGNDLSSHLVSVRFGATLPLAKQEVLLQQLSGENQQVSNWQPNMESPSYTEHVPFYINQNFPSNPASAMRLQQNVSLPFNGSVPPPSIISQRLVVNKASRNTINLKAPIRQPQHATANSSVPLNTSPPGKTLTTMTASGKPTSPKKSTTYKSRLLEANSQHKVFVSFAEEGPELFAVQLVADAKKLQDMMDDINRRPHRSLTEPPMIGTVCLGRMSGDRIICRAIVMNLSGSQCKLFFVDFGDTEMVSYYDIFDIPEEFVKPNVFAMRFCLSGVKKLERGPYLNEMFKQLVNGKVLTLKVVAPEGPPLIQYGELCLDNKNVLDLLMANMKDKMQFKWLEMLSLGTRQSIMVSYVDSCIKFYIQLSDNIDDLNAVMDAVKSHCESTSSPGELPVGAACCARFSDDDNWYRARVKSTKGKNVVVIYVDYGNEQEIAVSDLRTITPDLIRLPAQAMKCALKGFENKPVESTTSNLLEMLALEKTLMAQIVGVLSNDTMLVSLVDDTVSPPLDIARKMNQLSQPRSTHEVKPTTPVRKDAPESFSSPEGSVPDESRKKSFRREKSFKEDRRPPKEGNEDFAQRGGSFRGRDKDSFDRSGAGRHSEKFGGRPDRPDRNDRRGGAKPWENNAASATAPASTPAPAPAPAPAGDNWQDSVDAPAAPSASSAPAPRQNNRKKPRADQQQHDKPKPGWRNKDATGVGKRLKQAAEAASVDTQSGPRGSSVQDRLKRENKFNQQEHWQENKTDDWGNRGGREGRPDRRDNRGDKRDNWGDKKENHQKREFRDNREFKDNRDFRDNRELRERGDRTERSDRPPRSNFTPRDRADRSDKSFGSDSDKRSERGFKSQDGGRERAARAPPHRARPQARPQARPPAPQLPCKELADPVPLGATFPEPAVELGAQHEVSVTWIISPENFYTQILSLQPKFLEMMHGIPELYKGVKSYAGNVGVGASVLARYPDDGVLYRATIISVQPFSKFIVRYVDFGNKQLVDAKDIWQLDKQLMELPKMAVHCSLLGVVPKDGEWKADPQIDLCFNAPRYQCAFQECAEDQYRVSLWNNGASVADMLVEKQLAKLSDHQSSVTLKDEAIDLTIIVGQQILCRVTHVESYDKFYVQLDLEKAALVESAIANSDPSKLGPISADSLVEGIHCTLKHDGKIYRAILEDVSDTNKIQAALPDYGNTITTSLDKLMVLPTELSVYYYQSLVCCLNNYSSESKTLLSIDELKQRLTGNKFIVYINSVKGISLVTTLYDSESGQKVAIFEPDDGAYDEVAPLCMRSVFNYNFGMAYISHADNLNEFYLQRAADGDRIAQLLDDLFKFYEEGTPEALTSFEVDGMCVAKSSDSNWYRATIIGVEDTQVKVQYPDYGNTETVPRDSLKKLDPKFFEPCALALVASLGLVALHQRALAALTEWTQEKEVQVTLAFGADGWLASLHLDGVDLSMKLVNEKLATPQVAPAEELKREAPAEEPISLPAGCTQVYISHVDSPGLFWLQMVDKVDKIEAIQADLQANADGYAEIENREMGTLCVAKYLADDQWYRAEILDSDSDITTVRFIDYGNTDVLDNQPGLIKVTPDHLKAVEGYAGRSSVNAIPTGTGQWSEPASDYFTQLVGDLSAPVDALFVLKDALTYVDIFVNGQNLTDKLVAEGHATRSEEPECGDLPSCFASHVNSPSEFWIQLETATSELQAIEAAMDDVENFPELSDKEEGVICAAKYPEDGAWYRAQVIVDGSEGTEVLFMDYGNASIANELRSLPDELKLKPALSRKCALQKPRDIKSWSRKSEIKFNELAAEGATIFNVQFVAAGDISIVELYLEGKSVTEELVGLCEEQPPTERPTPVGQDLLSDGKICYVNSLDEFYVQLDNAESDLDKIIERMGNAEEFDPATELKVGSVCAAFWSEDEQWYRAKILEFCDIGYHMQFLDYGNKAKCEEFRQLPEDLAAIEPLAKCCRLAGILDSNSLNESGRNKLDTFAAEVTTFQIEFLDTTKEPILVKMLLEGKDLVTIISEDALTTANTDKGDAIFVSENLEPLENNTSSQVIAEVVDKTATLDTVKSNVPSLTNKDTAVQEKEKGLDVNDVNEASFEDANEELDSELNTSQPDLNESLESNHTVIENKLFSAEADNLSDDISIDEGVKVDTMTSPDKDISDSTLESSNDTIKTPEREESKESINADTGYISSGDNDKLSKESLTVSGSPKETQSPSKEPQSPAKEPLKECESPKEPQSPVKAPLKECESPKQPQSPAKEPLKECESPKEPQSPAKEPIKECESPKEPQSPAKEPIKECESPKEPQSPVKAPLKECESPKEPQSPAKELLKECESPKQPQSPAKEPLKECESLKEPQTPAKEPLKECESLKEPQTPAKETNSLQECVSSTESVSSTQEAESFEECETPKETLSPAKTNGSPVKDPISTDNSSEGDKHSAKDSESDKEVSKKEPEVVAQEPEKLIIDEKQTETEKNEVVDVK